MMKRYFVPALVVVVMTLPASAQRRDRGAAPTSLKASPAFLALFKETVAETARSTVRVQVDGKDVALGAVVAADGSVLTKASELKLGKLSVKTHDGRDLDARVTAASEAFDLAVLHVDGTGLTPIQWATSGDAPVGNWVAVAGIGAEPVAVGVVSTPTRIPPGPPGPPRVPTEQSGFLGVRMDMEGTGAVIDQVTPESAADRAGIKVRDRIVQIDDQEIVNQEALINTLLSYKAGEKVTIHLERDGKRMSLTATLGKRTPDLIPKGRGPNRGDMQNAMGSTLSDRRTGFPRFFQTDAVVRPSDCGGPLVDLDGRVIGLMIARAGRTESHVLPAQTLSELVPILLAARPGMTPAERVAAARQALTKAQEAKVSGVVLAEARRQVEAAVDYEAEWKSRAWWDGHPIETGPAPRALKAK